MSGTSGPFAPASLALPLPLAYILNGIAVVLCFLLLTHCVNLLLTHSVNMWTRPTCHLAGISRCVADVSDDNADLTKLSP